MKIITCKQCNEKKQHKAFGLCRKCWERQHTRPIIICRICNKKKEHSAHNLCKSCNTIISTGKIIVCNSCNLKKRHKAFGLCEVCYKREVLSKTNKFITNRRKYDNEQYNNNPIRRNYKMNGYKTRKINKSSCQVCGHIDIEVHHINKDNSNNETSNLMFLCKKHHFMIHNKTYLGGGVV